VKRFNKIYLIDSMTSSKMEKSRKESREEQGRLCVELDRRTTVAGPSAGSVLAAEAKNV